MSTALRPRLGARPRRLLPALAVLGALALPLVMSGSYARSVALIAAIYVIVGTGMHVILGEAGLLHLGYAAFFGTGAYVVALGATYTDVSFWVLLPLAVVAAAVLGLLIGFPTIRISGTYFVLATLAFGEIFRISVLNVDFTGGPNGLPGIPRPSVAGTVLGLDQLYYVTVLAAAGCMWGMGRLRRSRIGRAWQVVREDELAAASLGINTVLTKLGATAIGAAIGGLAGALFAVRQSFVSPESFTFFDSFIVVVIVAVGGMGSLPGVLVGVGAMIVLPEALRAAEDYRTLIFGVAIVAMMLLRPQGVVPGRPSGADVDDRGTAALRDSVQQNAPGAGP